MAAGHAIRSPQPVPSNRLTSWLALGVVIGPLAYVLSVTAAITAQAHW